MRRHRAVVLVAVALLVAACGDTADVDPSPTPPTATSAADAVQLTEQPPLATTDTTVPDPIVQWCLEVDPDFCAWGVAAVHGQPERLECLLQASTQNEFINSDCNRSEDPPVTTIPGSDTPREPTDGEILTEMNAVQAEVMRVLAAAHADSVIDVALLLSATVDAPAAADVAVRLGYQPIGAWMTVPACVDGYAAIEMGSNPVARRFAYMDAAAEVGARLAAAEASGTPITGRFIFDAHLAEIELAGEALWGDGVLVEAVMIRPSVSAVPQLENDASVAAIRVLLASPEWALAPGDISDAAGLDCAGIGSD